MRMIDRLVRLAVRAYPHDFRRLLGADMERHLLAEIEAYRGRSGRLRASARALACLAGAAAAGLWERLRRATAIRRLAPSTASPALRFDLRAADFRVLMDKLVTELGLSVRRLGQAPGFAAASILTLALGVGASTTIFALVDGILLRPLPYPESNRLVAMRHTAPGLDIQRLDQSVGSYLLYRRSSRAFAQMGLYHFASGNLAGDGDPERLRLALVTPSLLQMLGAVPVRGRLLGDEDAVPTQAETVLISEALWKRRFGADPSILGRVLQINGRGRRVVGVLPSTFAFPSPDTQVWFALSTSSPEASFGGFFLGGVGRLRPGVTLAEAEADLRRLIPSFAQMYEEATPEFLDKMGLAPVLVPLHDAIVGDVGGDLWVLLAAVAGVLLISSANVAGLLLVRAEHRHQEIAVRDALGAGFGDRLRDQACESSLLALLGGGLGIVIAATAVPALVRSPFVDLPRLHEVAVDGAAVAFTATVTLCAALAFTVVPLSRRRRGDLARALSSDARGATASVARQRARRLLVAGQLALAMVLLVGSGLLLQSFRRLRAVEIGFEPHGVLTVQLGLPFRGYEDYSTARAFYAQLLERVRALPEVSAVGAATQVPLEGSGLFEDPLTIEGGPAAADELPPVVSYVYFTPGYFEALGIGLEAGRSVEPEDAGAPAAPVLLSRSLARRLGGGEPVLGRRVRHSGPWHPVVGVVGDVRDSAVGEPPGEIVYMPVLETAPETSFVPRRMTLVVRTDLPPLAVVPAVRRLIRALDPTLPIASLTTMDEIVGRSTGRTRFTMTLLAAAAAAALFLAAIGVYGVISYAVSRRTREIGIRMALGARAADVGRMVLREGLALGAAGLLVGVALAGVLARFLEALLFQVGPGDPSTYAVTGALLLAAALLAVWVPSRRASRVEPVRALTAD